MLAVVERWLPYTVQAQVPQCASHCLACIHVWEQCTSLECLALMLLAFISAAIYQLLLHGMSHAMPCIQGICLNAF